MAVATFFIARTDLPPDVETSSSVHLASKLVAVPIPFKYFSAVLTADPVIIPDSFGVFAKHMDEKMANQPVFQGWLRVDNADSADSSSDRSPKASPQAFYDRGMCIGPLEMWYCS